MMSRSSVSRPKVSLAPMDFSGSSAVLRGSDLASVGAPGQLVEVAAEGVADRTLEGA